MSLVDLIPALHTSSNVPHNSLQPQILRLNIAFIAITSSIITLRILVRALIVKHVAWEDYLMIAAGVFATAFSGVAISGLRYGLGKHIWDIPQEPPSVIVPNVKRVIQTLWICQVTYSTSLTLVKLSIIASYLRIFPTPLIRRIMYLLATSIIAVWLVNIFATIFQCDPVDGAWNFDVQPKCISVMKVYYFSTAFSILTDILLCVLPLPLFWKLKLPVREKWIVTVLFGLGLFASAASIMRITVLGDVQNTDSTVGAVPTMNWSVVEVGTGIICACVPVLKPLMKKLMPAKFATSRSRSRSRSRPLDSKAHGGAEEVRELRQQPQTNFSRPHGNWHNSQIENKTTASAEKSEVSREFV